MAKETAKETKTEAIDVPADEDIPTVAAEDVKIPEQVQLSIVERHALARAYDELNRVSRDVQEVGREIMAAHGVNSDHMINPVDMERGIVQFLTREQVRTAQAKQTGG